MELSQGLMESQPQVPVVIRPIARSEFSEAVELIHLSIETLCAEDYSQKQLTKITHPYHRAFLRQADFVFVAEFNDTLVGISILSRSKFLPNGSIEGVFAHPDYIHQKIGTKLVRKIEEQAKQKNLARINVISSLTAIQFYRSLAYEIDRKITLLGDVKCVKMHKQLRQLNWTDWFSAIAIFSFYLVILLILAIIYTVFIQ